MQFGSNALPRRAAGLALSCHSRMGACIIFNPTARGDKARRFLRELASIAGDWALKPTTRAGEATALAQEAVESGFGTIIAAGGDGTVSEVVQGIGLAHEGLQRTRLGIVPLGTMNVLARELDLPHDLREAWAVLKAGRESRIDLPCAEHGGSRPCVRRFFVQLAGAGLDARAVAAVDWEWKKRVGVLAYLAAGIRAFVSGRPVVRVRCGTETAQGELILIGNGRFYGGSVPMFPAGNMRDGLLEVRVVPRVTSLDILQFGWAWLWDCGLTFKEERFMRAARVELSSDVRVPFQVDGDNVGFLPVTFSVQREALRVIVP